VNEHERCEEQIKELEEEIDKYHGFTIRVSQILTSLNLEPMEQRNAISLTYAKMVWPDIWDDKREIQLKELEKRI